MTYRAIAERFGDRVVRQDYSAAWDLLAKEAQALITPEAIKTAVTTLIAYAPGPIQAAQVMEEFIVEEWPDKRPSDLAVVYVALTGSNFSEAVTVTLAQYGKDALIRHLEWGRP